MDVLRILGSKLRTANEAVASAQKSWRDEGLTHREHTVNEREERIAKREAEVASQLQTLRSLERGRSWRKVKYAAIALAAAVPSFIWGNAIGTTQSGGNTNRSALPAMTGTPPPAPEAQPNFSNPEEIYVPYDPNAQHKLISWRNLPNGNRESMTLRRGSSGDVYARREHNCADNTFRYLGEGETYSEALRERPSPNMAPLTSGSISSDISEVVCAK